MLPAAVGYRFLCDRMLDRRHGGFGASDAGRTVVETLQQNSCRNHCVSTGAW